jgi:aminopeptidase N
MYKTLAVSGMILALAACKTSRKATEVTRTNLPEFTIGSGAEAQLAVYRATPERSWDLLHTVLDVRFDMAKHQMPATARLYLTPLAYAQDTLVLQAKGMLIQEVKSVSGKNSVTMPYDYNGKELTLRPGKTFKPGDTLELYIRYTARPDEVAQQGSAAIRDAKGLYFINTRGENPYKPLQIWTQGETESSSCWFPTIDRPNERCTHEIAITVPDTLQTLSNGRLASSTPESGGMRRDVWKMEQPTSPYLFMMAIGQYAVAKESWRGREVSYYVEPKYAATAKGIFSNTPEMIEFFSTKLGVDFPWNKYAQITGRDYVSGAMENTSASLFGEFIQKDAIELQESDNEEIVAHELFHQWFGGLVIAESWSNITMNESFATFGEQLWDEYKYGMEKADEGALKDLYTYLNFTRFRNDPLVRYYYKDKEEVFDRISYQKGGRILNMLRHYAGEELFFRAVKQYLTQNAFSSGEPAQLRLALEKETGKDWNWFFNQWYYRSGHPKVKFTYTYNDTARQVVLTAEQLLADSAGIFRLPFKVAVLGEGSQDTVPVNMTGKLGQWTFAYKGDTRPLVIPDVEHILVADKKDQRSTEDWARLYRKGPGYIDRYEAIDELAKLQKEQIAMQALREAVNDKNASLRQRAIDKINWKTVPAFDALWTTVAGKAQNDNNAKVRSAALRALVVRKNSADKQLAEFMLQDPSYSVQATALRSLYQMANPEGLGKATELAPTAKGELVTAIAEIFAKTQTDHHNWYVTQLHTVLRNPRNGLFKLYGKYIEQLTDTQLKEQGKQQLETLLKQEDNEDFAAIIKEILDRIQPKFNKS